MFRKLLRNACGGLQSSIRSAAAQSAQRTRCNSGVGPIMETGQKQQAAAAAAAVMNMGREFVLSEDALADVSELMTLKGSTAAAGLTADCWTSLVRERPPPVVRSRASDHHRPVHHVLRGEPASRFLGLDLIGARHFRTRLVDIYPDYGWGVGSLVRCETHALPAALRTGPGRELFDTVAERLAAFADRFHVRAARLPVLFAFGFPVRQVSPTAAVLRRWTKEFDCADLVCRDVVAELRDALHRAELRAGPVTLLNDATAAVIDGAARDPATRVCVVVDDGCNCSYVADGARPHRGCVHALCGLEVNTTEWGAFGEDGALRHVQTEYDRRLDARSRHPGKRVFEKMTSGMYMGELVREVVMAMTHCGALFNGTVTQPMTAEYSVNAEHLCRAESDATGSYAACREVLKTVLDVAEPTDADCEVFRYACECVTTRSAHLVAAGLAGVLRRRVAVRACGGGPDDSAGKDAAATVVAAEGTVFEVHRKYAETVDSVTRRLLSNSRAGEDSVEFTLRSRGSRLAGWHSARDSSTEWHQLCVRHHECILARSLIA